MATNTGRGLFSRLFALALPRVTPFKEQGTSGVAIQGGMVRNVERSSKWTGFTKYQTAQEIAINISIVAAGVHHFLNLVAHPQWSVKPADEDDAESVELAEFVEDVLQDMVTPWPRIVRRAGMYRFHGFGIQEWIAKKRDDGRIGFLDIEPRPQHTIERWEVDDDGSVLGMWQRSPQTGQLLGLNRKKLIYLVEDTLSDSPEGLGIFRHLAEPYERLKQYLELEARAFERDLRGIPIGRVPITKIRDLEAAGKLKPEEAKALINVMTDFVSLEMKKSDTGLVLDSQPYESQAADGLKIAGQPQWGLELLQGSSNGLSELDRAIDRLQREMARIIGTEHLMMGDAGGNRALAVDKSRNLYLIANSVLSNIADGMDHDMLEPLWTLNNFDPKKKPKLVAEDVAFKDVAEVTAALRDLATAGAPLQPDDEAINDVRDLLGISRAPELDPVLVETMRNTAAGLNPDGTVPAPAPPPGMVAANDDSGKKPDAQEEATAEDMKPAKKPAANKAYDPDQARDELGRWSDDGGGDAGVAGDHPSLVGYSSHAYIGKDGRLHTSKTKDAVKALYENRDVVLTQPRDVATLLDKLKGIADRAKAEGKDAPVFDLCRVSVSGSNLFCAESKGIPRAEMPQLSGLPVPGSKADSLPKNEKGEVDSAQEFERYLAQKGYEMTSGEKRADYLKASQRELNGAKVAGIFNAMETGKLNAGAQRLFTSADDYIIDGHHRWAAAVGVGYRRGASMPKIPTLEVNTDVITLLREANTFTRQYGIAQKSITTKAWPALMKLLENLAIVDGQEEGVVSVDV